MPKHIFRVGQRVAYAKFNHRYQRVNYIFGVVIRVSTNRVIIRDGFGVKHFVKPANLSSLTEESR